MGIISLPFSACPRAPVGAGSGLEANYALRPPPSIPLSCSPSKSCRLPLNPRPHCIPIPITPTQTGRPPTSTAMYPEGGALPTPPSTTPQPHNPRTHAKSPARSVYTPPRFPPMQACPGVAPSHAIPHHTRPSNAAGAKRVQYNKPPPAGPDQLPDPVPAEEKKKKKKKRR